MRAQDFLTLDELQVLLTNCPSDLVTDTTLFWNRTRPTKDGKPQKDELNVEMTRYKIPNGSKFKYEGLVTPVPGFPRVITPGINLFATTSVPVHSRLRWADLWVAQLKHEEKEAARKSELERQGKPYEYVAFDVEKDKELKMGKLVDGKAERYRWYTDVNVQVAPFSATQAVRVALHLPLEINLWTNLKKAGPSSPDLKVLSLVGVTLGVSVNGFGAGLAPEVCADGAVRLRYELPNGQKTDPKTGALVPATKRLIFFVEGAICGGAPYGVKAVLGGGLIGKWEAPLGLSWLTINNLGARVGLSPAAASFSVLGKK